MEVDLAYTACRLAADSCCLAAAHPRFVGVAPQVAGLHSAGFGLVCLVPTQAVCVCGMLICSPYSPFIIRDVTACSKRVRLRLRESTARDSPRFDWRCNFWFCAARHSAALITDAESGGAPRTSGKDQGETCQSQCHPDPVAVPCTVECSDEDAFACPLSFIAVSTDGIMLTAILRLAALHVFVVHEGACSSSCTGRNLYSSA